MSIATRLKRMERKAIGKLSPLWMEAEGKKAAALVDVLCQRIPDRGKVEAISEAFLGSMSASSRRADTVHPLKDWVELAKVSPDDIRRADEGLLSDHLKPALMVNRIDASTVEEILQQCREAFTVETSAFVDARTG